MKRVPYCLSDAARPYPNAAPYLFSARTNAWHQYELTCWMEAVRERGLSLLSLDDAIRQKIVRILADNPQNALPG